MKFRYRAVCADSYNMILRRMQVHNIYTTSSFSHDNYNNYVQRINYRGLKCVNKKKRKIRR